MEIGCGFSKGNLAIGHDLSVKERANHKSIDRSLSEDNVVLLDMLQGRTEKEFINDVQQPYIDAYNAKQKRNDRKVTEKYSDWWEKNGQYHKGNNEMLQEFVVSFGDRNTLGKSYYQETDKQTKAEMKQMFTDMYSEALKSITEAYPHMKPVAAAIHFDEPNGTPHMHMIVLPIGEGYKRMFERQVSCGRALELDGIKRLEDMSPEEQAKYQNTEKPFAGYQISRWSKDIRHNILNPIAESYGFDIKAEQHGRKHEKLNDEIRAIIESKDRMEQENEKIQTAQLEKILANNEQLKKSNKDLITLRTEIDSGKRILSSMKKEYLEEKKQLANINTTYANARAAAQAAHDAHVKENLERSIQNEIHKSKKQHYTR